MAEHRMDHYGCHVCGNCAYFRKFQQDEDGLCCLNPPQPVVAPGQEGDMVIRHIRPIVKADAFCSRHSDVDGVDCGCTMGDLQGAAREAI